MNENLSSKNCPICYKEIDTRAKKCPYCHHWQSKILLLLYNPVFSFVWIFAIMIGFQAYFKSQIMGGEEAFNSNKDKISIVNSELKFGENKCGSLAIILGNIKNDAPISWQNPNFEIRFYDKDKKLFDTKQDDIYSFEIPANGTIPFKLSMPMNFSQDSYHTYEVKILSAKKKGSFF